MNKISNKVLKIAGNVLLLSHHDAAEIQTSIKSPAEEVGLPAL